MAIDQDAPTSGPRGGTRPSGAPRTPPLSPPATGVVADVPTAVGPRRAGWTDLASSVLGMFAVVVVMTVLVAGPLGALRQGREQDAAYARLRQELAEATAPLNPPIAFGRPVAVLSIPRLSLRSVVLEGTTGSVLRGGPGHRADSVLPAQAGTSIVYGKALTYGAPFRNIPSLGPGDGLVVTTGQGEFAFRVERVRRPGDPLPRPLGTGGSRLILATAEGSPIPERTVFVDAALVGTAQPASVHPAAVAAAERALGVDTAPLLPLVLLLPVLLSAVVAVLVLRDRWGRAQGFLVGAPPLLLLAWCIGDEMAALLPNLL